MQFGHPNDGIHDVKITVTLGGLNGDVGDVKLGVNRVEEGPNHGDPETLKVWGIDVWFRKERGAEAGAVLGLVKRNVQEVVWLARFA